MGTTAAVRVILPAPLEHVPNGLWCYKVDAAHELLGGAMSEGGNVYAWLKSLLRIDDNKLVKNISNLEPDKHGLTFLPLLAGERAPGWIGSARGTIHGISLATEPIDILHAGLEGVAYRIGLVYRLLEPHLDGDVNIIANGGALVNSPEWLQIIADVLGKRVELSAASEASSLGAGMIALKNLGVVEAYDEFEFSVAKTFDPHPGKYDIYQQAMERQQALYQRVVNTHE
jgi:gluconokinase